MNDDICYFKDLIVDGRKVDKMEFVQIHNDLRIYYSKNHSDYSLGNGFNFVVCEAVSVTCTEKYDPNVFFEDETSKAEVVFHGVAFYDGLRHLYMGHESTDNQCYLYYPNTKLFLKIFEELRKLEEKFCSGLDANPNH